MKPDQGLFQSDFDDFHAALGVPITADAKAVRKRYLTIARKLHPDSLGGAAAVDARQASEILSKLVNPAYEALSQEKSTTEHMLVLKLKGQSLRRASAPPPVTTAAAQALLKAPNSEQAYRQSVNALAETQFDDLNTITGVMGQISELNLVYLYRSTHQAEGVPTKPAAQAAAASSPPPSGSVPSPAPRPARTILESYLNRAQGYEQAKDYSRAMMEMREAVKTYPNDGQCHSYLAALYLKAGQSTMARIHAKRALDINPNDERAKLVQTRVEKAGSTAGSAKASGSKPTSGKGASSKGANPKDADKGGGFFGLFGGKKKS